MRYTFIVNPAAGSVARRIRALENALRRSGLQFRIRETTRPRDAVELARKAAREGDVVVAVGGDGTVHEVVSGIAISGADAELAVLSWGSGNDFAKMFEMPVSAWEAIETLRTSNPTRIDLGRVTWDGPGGTGDALFANVAGTGIDAKVAAAASRFKWLRGTPKYLAAVFRTLGDWSAPQVSAYVDACGASRVAVDARILLVLVGNGRCAAGGFYLVPDARVDDGALDVCLVRSTSFRRILALIPAVLRGGRHTGAGEVVMGRGQRIVVTSEEPLAVQADGEVLTIHASTVAFEVLEKALAVRMPLKAASSHPERPNLRARPRSVKR